MCRSLTGQLHQIPGNRVDLHGRTKREIETYQWDIIHAEYDYALMLGSIFCYSTKVCLEDVVAIQEGHFAVGFDPDLEADVRRERKMSGRYTLYFAYWAM